MRTMSSSKYWAGTPNKYVFLCKLCAQVHNLSALAVIYAQNIVKFAHYNGSMHKHCAYDTEYTQKMVFSVQSIVQHPAAQMGALSLNFVQAALAQILPTSLKAELKKQMEEEADLNKRIKEDLSKIKVK